jgi:hypothetical protein
MILTATSGLIFAISSETGWTLDRLRPARMIVFGFALARDFATWLPIPPLLGPVIMTRKN